MTNQQHFPAWWQVMGQHFPYRQFAVGTLVPLLIFTSSAVLTSHSPVPCWLGAGGWACSPSPTGMLDA